MLQELLIVHKMKDENAILVKSIQVFKNKIKGKNSDTY